MNRRNALAVAMGSLGSLAMINIGNADEKKGKVSKTEETKAILTCPIYKSMDNGSYWTYYAMQTTPTGGSPCSNPTMLFGPPNLGLGCPNGTGCASKILTLKEFDALIKGGGDDVAFHGNLETVGADGPITFPEQFPNGVFPGRSGRYRLRGNNRLKKGNDDPGNQPVDVDVILREVVMWPPQFWPNPSTASHPAKILYFAQEVDVDDSIPEDPVFGDIKKVAKLKNNGHHFRIKLKKVGQGGGAAGDSDREFDFTLLARRKPM